jgi:hypothetical protein
VNRIEILPRELGELPRLGQSRCNTNSYVDGWFAGPSEFYVANNPITSLPEEVLAEGDDAILAYLRNEAWWHLQRLIVAGASALDLVTLFVLGLRWRNRRGKKKNG